VVSGQVTPDHWTVDRATGRVLTARVGAKLTWATYSQDAGRVVLCPLPGDLAGEASLTEEEVRYIGERAVAIESAAGGAPQDVEWAVARDLPFPDSVYFLQHRPETTWSSPPAEDPAASPPAEPARAAFDPVQYALRNVFKVPGA
jgi:pyruvate,water dikinase